MNNRVLKRVLLSLMMAVLFIGLFVLPVMAQTIEPPAEAETLEPGGVFGALAVIAGLAFLVETLVEALVGRIADHVPWLAAYKWLLIYIAVGVGILGAFVYKFDLIYLLSLYMQSPVPTTVFGIAITGVSIGMGAGYVHQFVSKYFPAQKSGGTE